MHPYEAAEPVDALAPVAGDFAELFVIGQEERSPGGVLSVFVEDGPEVHARRVGAVDNPVVESEFVEEELFHGYPLTNASMASMMRSVSLNSSSGMTMARE